MQPINWTSKRTALDLPASKRKRVGPPPKLQCIMKLSTLPNDLLSEVFSFLTFQDVLGRIAPSCKRLHDAALDRSYRARILCLALPASSFLPVQLAQLLHTLPRLETLELTGRLPFNDHQFECVIAKALPVSLLNLSVEWADVSVGDLAVQALACACPRLQSLSVFKGRRDRRAPERNKIITDASLDALKRHCPGLQQLCLAYTNVSKHGVFEFANRRRLSVQRFVEQSGNVSWGHTSVLLTADVSTKNLISNAHEPC